MSWQVELKYTPAGSWVDVTDKVLTHTIRRVWRKHNRLKPTANSLTFEMHRDTSVINNLLTNDDVEIRVHKSSADYFTGEVRHNFKIRTDQQIKPLKIECVDYSERLKKKMAFTAAWSNYKVIDTSNTSQSIVHQLLTQEGSGWTLSVSDIDRTIPLYVNVDGVDSKTYWQAITDLLFQFGYVWDINMSGEFTVWDILPATTSTSNVFSDANTRGTLELTKVLEEYDGVEVKWWTQKTKTGAIVFKDTTGGTSTSDMNVTLANGDTYPGNDSARPFYADYEYGGKDIIQVTSPSLDYAPGTLTQNTFTNNFKRAEVELENATGSSVDLTRFRITGDVTYRDQMNVVRSENWSSSLERLEIEAKDIYQSSDAEKLATGLKRYFQFSDFQYQLLSETEYEPGEFVDIDNDNLGINQRASIVTQEVVSEKTLSTLYKYVCEAITEYTPETTSAEGEHQPASDFDEQVGNLPSTGEILDTIDDGYNNTSGGASNPGTTTPTQPTLFAYPMQHSVALEWDRQPNLTNFDFYEVQVSEDNSNWFALTFGATGLGAADPAFTEWPVETLTHGKLPLDGTTEEPEAKLYYYRVRRRTKLGDVSAWSSVASAQALPTGVGDIAANAVFANNITLGAVGPQHFEGGAISVPTEGLELWFPFDGNDSDPTTIFDLSGSNNGTGTNVTIAPGVSGQGGSFDGTGEVTTSLSEYLFADSGEAWTLSFWASVDSGTVFDNGNIVITRETENTYNVQIRGADNDVYIVPSAFVHWLIGWDGTDITAQVNGAQLQNETASVLLDHTGTEITDHTGGSIDPAYDVWRAL